MPQTKSPWDQFAVVPEGNAAAADIDGAGGWNDFAPANDIAGTAAAAQPRPVAIPRPAMIDPRNPAPPAPASGPLVAGTDETQFGDGAGASGPNRRLEPAQENQLMGILWKGPVDSAAASARAYMNSIGWPVPANAFEDSVQARRQGQKPGWLQYDKAKPLADASGADAVLEGVSEGSTMGGTGKILSAIDATSTALGMGGRGDPNQSWGNNYRSTLDQYEATREQDKGAHPWLYAGGALAGSAMLPSKVWSVAEKAGYEAGRDALRFGATQEEARIVANIAARKAAAARGAGEGAAVGGATGVISADNPTDAIKKGLMGAGIGGVIGGGTIGIGGKFVRPSLPATARNGAREIADIARDLNIDPTPASVGGMPAELVQTGMASLPGAASAVAKASDREITGLGNATRRIAEGYGEPGDPNSTGEAIVEGAAKYRKDSRDQATALYEARDAAFNGTGAPVVLRNAGDLGAKFGRDFPTSDVLKKLSEHPIVAKLLGVADDVQDGEITLGEATDALSQVRSTVRNLEGTDKGPILNRARQLETALEKDVYDSAAAADQAAGRVPGSPGSAVKAQKDADAFYAERAATLKGPLGKAILSGKDPTKVSAESVYTQLAGDTASKGGNIDRLRKTWFRLPEETRGRFSATMLDDMGRPQASSRTLGSKFMAAVGLKGNDEARLSDGMAWSPETFLTNFNKMNPAARRVVFGKEGEAQILDIARYASKLRETGRGRNFSNTAKSAMTAGALYAVGNALMHGQLYEAGADVAGLAGSYAIGKLFLGTPKMRAWTLGAIRAASLPPKAQAAAQKVLLDRLPTIARSEPVFGPQIMELKRSLSAAASSTPNYAAANEGGDGAGVTDWDDPKYDSEGYGPEPSLSDFPATDAAPAPDAPAFDPNAPDDGTGQ